MAEQHGEPQQVLRPEARSTGRDHLKGIGCSQARQRSRNGANLPAGGLIPDSIAMTAVPLIDHDDLLSVQRVERMCDAGSDRRIAGAGCIR